PYAFLINHICAWIGDMAGDRPVVIVCAYGGRDGGHDGQTVRDRQLQRLLPDSLPGRLILAAAGNDGADGIHGTCTIGPGRPGRLTWEADAGVEIKIYIDGAMPDEVKVVPLGAVQLEVSKPAIHGLSGAWLLTVAGRGQGAVELSTT